MVDRTDLIPADDDLPSIEQWEAAKAVLLGLRAADGLISDWAAAREAGVSLSRLKAWVDRSKEERETDAPYIREIARVWATREHDQQDLLEDRLAGVAFSGREETTFVGVFDDDGRPVYGEDGNQLQAVKTRKVVGNTNLDALNKLIVARGRKYANRPQGLEVTVKMSDEDLLARLQAFGRFKQIEREKNNAIPGESRVVSVDEVGDFD